MDTHLLTVLVYILGIFVAVFTIVMIVTLWYTIVLFKKMKNILEIVETVFGSILAVEQFPFMLAKKVFERVSKYMGE